MSTQIVAVLCEGPHDVAFLNRILKTDGYVQEERVKLGEYPSPIDQLLIKEARESEVESLNIEELRRKLLPSHVLRRENIYLFLYSLGGDTKKNERERLLKSFAAFVPQDGQISVTPTDTQLAVLYFFDADEQGQAQRREEVNHEVSSVLEVEKNELFQAQGETKSVQGLQVGCYIFCELDSDRGKLESIVLPLMQRENESMFEAAGRFLDENHDSTRLKMLKFRVQEGKVIEKLEGKHKYDRSKSIIGTVGQLQVSGATNSVCIGRTDYLTLAKIQADPKCQEIIAFFREAVAQ